MLEIDLLLFDFAYCALVFLDYIVAVGTAELVLAWRRCMTLLHPRCAPSAGGEPEQCTTQFWQTWLRCSNGAAWWGGVGPR